MGAFICPLCGIADREFGFPKTINKEEFEIKYKCGSKALVKKPGNAITWVAGCKKTAKQLFKEGK